MAQSIDKLQLELAHTKEKLIKVESAYRLTQQYSQLLEGSNKKLDEKILEVSLLNEISKTFSSAVFDEWNISAFIFSLMKKRINLAAFALFLVDNTEATLVVASDCGLSCALNDEIRCRLIQEYSLLTTITLEPRQISLIEQKQEPQKHSYRRYPLKIFVQYL